jgi:hypothetical protein
MLGGVPQGTKLSPLLFLCMIDDLQPSSPAKTIKFVDDTTLSETIKKVKNMQQDSHMQESCDKLVEWTSNNNMGLNSKKTKDMLISFATNHISQILPIVISGVPVD